MSPHTRVPHLVVTLSACLSTGCGLVGLDEAELSSEPFPVMTGGSGDSSSGTGTSGSGGSDTVLASGGNSNQGGVDSCDDDCEPAEFFEEDFEEDPYGELWTSGGGELYLSSEETDGEGQALCAIQGRATSEAEIRVPIERVSAGTLYFRGWFYVPEGAINGRLKFVRLNSENGTSVDYSLLLGGALEVGQEEGVSEHSDDSAYPEGEWFCFQAKTIVDNDDGSLIASVNGVEQAALHGIDTRPGQGIDILVYGIAETDQGQSNGKLCLDEIAISTEPLSCD